MAVGSKPVLKFGVTGVPEVERKQPIVLGITTVMYVGLVSRLVGGGGRY